MTDHDKLDFSTNDDDYPESKAKLPLRRKVVIALVIAAGLALWVVGGLWVANAADMPDVQMMHMPGSSKSVPMPNAAMRSDIERRMRGGDVPKVMMADAGQMGAKCRSHGYLLGCTVGFRSLGKIIFIRKGMSRDLTHFTLVHEYAHALYGWKH